MMLKKALLWAQKELREVSERPRLEAEILLSHLLNCRREELILKEIQDLDFNALKPLIERRKNHEPIEYITNRVSFYDFELFIDKGALIPRPESELLVDKALELINKYNIKTVAEIGIGSAALSIAIARHSKVIIEASDISKDALKIAKQNIENFNLQDRIKLFKCNMGECFSPFELLISNPPYIDPNFELEPNVKNHEPHTALFAPNKGLELLFKILDEIKAKNIKYAVCEMGYDQKEPLANYAKEIGLSGSLEFYKDLAGHDRGFVFIYRIRGGILKKFRMTTDSN